ncbi:glycosyltransferase [Paenibacillus sp. FSL L8-0470]|uniref:glycosyltransferase n=1 Tax=unclassified Paenibacillus TaxID=185978 RepID=UPI0030F53C58
MKKKILLIHHWSTIGGSGISLFNTWQSLKEEFDVVTYIPDNPPSLNDFLLDKGLVPKTYSFTCGQIPYYSGGSNIFRPGFWYLIMCAITQSSYWKKVINEEKPDLVIVNSKVLCWMGKYFKKTKSLCFVRETIEGKESNVINKIMKRMLERFSLVSFLSEYDLEQTNLKCTSTIVSPDFLFPEEYSDKKGRNRACEQLKVEPKKFNIAFVGGIDKLKGFDIAVKALTYLKDKNIKLLVAGNDFDSINRRNNGVLSKLFKRRSLKFSESMKEYINKHELNDFIQFVGVQNDVSTLYSASDVLVFPMNKPHQARPAFEIGVQKKPVIITDFINIREFVVNGINGLTFEPNNPQALAESIIKVESNQELFNTLGAANFEYTMKYHTEEYAMTELKAKIHELLR